MVIPFSPFSYIGIGPGRISVGVTKITGVGGLVFGTHRRRWWKHGMVGSVHACKRCHRHVAGDALVTFASNFVMGMGRCIINFFCMTGHAGVVCFFFGFEAAPAAAGVTGDTVKLARLEAWTHEPRGVSIIFSEVAAVGIKIRVLKCDEIIVVEKFLTRRKRGRQGNHLGMASSTRSIALVWGK